MVSHTINEHTPPLEPEQAKSSAQPYLRFKDLSDGHAGVNEFLSSFITDTGHEGCWLTDQTQLLQTKNTCR